MRSITTVAGRVDAILLQVPVGSESDRALLRAAIHEGISKDRATFSDAVQKLLSELTMVNTSSLSQVRRLVEDLFYE